MKRASREQRVRDYREKSKKADELVEYGKKSKAIPLLRGGVRKARKAGDEDYRLFLEAEVINCTNPEYPRQIELLDKAFAWVAKQGLAVDDFLLVNQGVYYSLAGDADSAVKCWRKALAANAENCDAMRNIGMCVGKEGDYHSAVSWFDKVLTQDPTDLKSMRYKAMALAGKGEYGAAMDWFDKALAENPKDWNAMREKGVALANKGDTDAAVHWLDKALAENPNDWSAMRNMGVVLAVKGHHDEAIKWYDKVLAENAKDSDAMRERGVSLGKKGCLDAAIEWFGRALSENPRDWNSMRNMGVALAGKGERDSAIKWYDKALRENPKDWKTMHNRGVALSERGDHDGGLEWFDRALAENANDWNAMREKGVVLGKKGDLQGAVEWLSKGLAEHPKDWIAMRNMGVALATMGDLDGAVTWYDKALGENPKDWNAMRAKGLAVAKRGDLDEGLQWLENALVENPNDWNTIREKGAMLGNKGDLQGAVGCFAKALALNPRDAASHREWAVAEFHRGRFDEAFGRICDAVKIEPRQYEEGFRFVCAALNKNADEEWSKLFPGEGLKSAEPEERFADLRGFIVSIREAFREDADAFLEQKEEDEKKRRSFLQPSSRLDPARSLLMVLRKWNSYTPAIPSAEEERSRGGGYFLWHKGRGTVIDPGYNFLENFHEAGCGIDDIHNVILTHAHNDHTIDFETLLTLFHEFNSNLPNDKEDRCKQVNLFLNNGAFMKFSGLIDLKRKEYTGLFCTMNPGNVFALDDDIRVDVLPAYHEETVATGQSVGLLLTVQTTQGERKILLSGDTGLFPPKGAGGRLVPPTQADEVWKGYPGRADKPDLMIAHIGSIKKEELKWGHQLEEEKLAHEELKWGHQLEEEKLAHEVDLKEELKLGHEVDLKNVCYPNHLGIIGSARLITMLRPKLAVISELGEEMRQFRCPLVRGLQSKVVDRFFLEDQDPYVPRVVPGDLPFVYDLEKRAFFCCVTQEWVGAAEICFAENRKGDLGSSVYYFHKDKEQDFKDHIAQYAKRFNNAREDYRRELYFRDDAS